MASIVVGTLRAVLALDAAQYEAGTKKIVGVNNALGQSLDKLTPQAEKMAKAFGGEKLIASANNLVAAVQRVGGAANLTSTEQLRANRTVTEAIAKYAQLGQSAPPAMLALQRATAGATTQTGRFGVSLDQARGMLAAFGLTLGVGTVVAFGRSLLETADQLVKVADRTGLTTTEVQRLQYIAGQSGNTIDELTSAIGRLQNNLISGDKSAINAVKVLGINLAELKTQSPYLQLQSIATEIAKIPDPAARAAIAIDLFGRTGAAILPTLIADFKGLGNEAPVMRDKTVRAVEEMGDQLHRAKQQLTVWAAEAFHFVARILDTVVIAYRRANAVYLDSLASIVEMTARAVPGMSTVFKAMGISVADLRQEAQWARDAADAMTVALNRTDVEVRKNTGSLIDYDALLNTSTRTTKTAATETDKLAESYARLNSEVANLQGMALMNRDAELMSRVAELRRMATVTGDPLQGLTPVRDEMILPSGRIAGAMGATIPDIARRQAQEVRSVWAGMAEGATRSLQLMDTAIAGSFAQMMLGAKGFKDGFLDIWRSIKAGVVNLLGEILSYFTRQFLGGLIKSMSTAKLAQAAGNAVAGGSMLGGAASAATTGASVAGVAGVGGAGAAGAGAAGGVGAGGTAAGVGTGIGLGTTLAITGGAAAGVILAWAIWKKGLFRGGEESLKVHPRRNRFLSQFGGPGTGEGSGFHELAEALTALTKQEGGGSLHAALRMARTAKEWERAQAAIVGVLSGAGLKGVQSFALGGFVPPGVVQPAILHGGRFGEDIVPRTASSQAVNVNQHYTVNINTQALNTEGFDKVFASDILPRLQWEFTLNQRGTTSVLEKALAR